MPLSVGAESTLPIATQSSEHHQPSEHHSFPERSQRIITAGGSITEIVDALGLIQNVVAVDSSSLYPEPVTKLPQVGYFRSLGAEGLLSLSPDVVVAARGAGPKAVLEQVANTGVMVKQFEQSVYTLDSWVKLIQDMGAFFNQQTKAESLINSAISNIRQGQAKRDYSKPTINAIALLNSGHRGPTVAGKNTMPDFLLTLAGINNLASDLVGYKPFSAELLANSEIDLILVPRHNLEAMGGIEGVCEQQPIKYATIQGCHVYVMDALLLLGFGARIDQAVNQVIERANTL